MDLIAGLLLNVASESEVLFDALLEKLDPQTSISGASAVKPTECSTP